MVVTPARRMAAEEVPQRGSSGLVRQAPLVPSSPNKSKSLRLDVDLSANDTHSGHARPSGEKQSHRSEQGRGKQGKTRKVRSRAMQGTAEQSMHCSQQSSYFFLLLSSQFAIIICFIVSYRLFSVGAYPQSYHMLLLCNPLPVHELRGTESPEPHLGQSGESR